MMVVTFCVHLFIMTYFPLDHYLDCYMMFIYFENLNPYLYHIHVKIKCTLNLLHINQTIYCMKET